MPSLREIAHQFETATTRPALIQALQAATGFLGFQSFSVTMRLVNIGGGAWRILMSSMPKDYLAWYEKEQVLAHDPLLHRGLEAVAPFFSDELEATELARSPGAFAYLQSAGRFGLGLMLTGAQHDHEGATTVVTLAQPHAGLDRRLAREQVPFVLALLHDALGRVVTPQVAARRGPLGSLTRLEQSMLELLARGHGAREIAQLLAVSPRSVRYHATRVREKLGATTLNQAVSRAIESRKITLSGSALPAHWAGLPKVVMVQEREGAWSMSRPSLADALEEVRAATSLDVLAQAARRAAAAAGFGRYAFVMRAPAGMGIQPLVLTNEPAARSAADDPQSLLHHSLSQRPQLRCVPWFWDERDPAAAVKGQMPTLTAATLGSDGCRSVLAFALDDAVPTDRFEARRVALALSRALHERACVLLSLPRPELSESDLQALHQMVHGSSIRRVAADQHHKERTLRYRLTVVARKLGARNSRHALAIATERGLLPRDLGRLLSRELVRPLMEYRGASGTDR